MQPFSDYKEIEHKVKAEKTDRTAPIQSRGNIVKLYFNKGLILMKCGSRKGINVLSLCDGMSCGQIALTKLGVPINNYYAFEIKDHAIYTTQLNFPRTIQLGNVNDFDIEMLNGDKIDLFLCGSPCQNLSCLNRKYNTGLEGEKSSLFYKCVEILEQVKPTYFLFENVKSMKVKDKVIFTEMLGVEPIHIDSALVSAQTRNRLYWTNIPYITMPEDRGIYLKDILEKNATREENWTDKKTEFIQKRLNKSRYVQVDGEKSIPITARGYRAWNTQYVTYGDSLRDLTIKEYMRLQTIPEWYNWGMLNKGRITDLIGDGWTIDIIAHMLSNMELET